MPRSRATSGVHTTIAKPGGAATKEATPRRLGVATAPTDIEKPFGTAKEPRIPGVNRPAASRPNERRFFDRVSRVLRNGEHPDLVLKRLDSWAMLADLSRTNRLKVRIKDAVEATPKRSEPVVDMAEANEPLISGVERPRFGAQSDFHDAVTRRLQATGDKGIVREEMPELLEEFGFKPEDAQLPAAAGDAEWASTSRTADTRNRTYEADSPGRTADSPS